MGDEEEFIFVRLKALVKKLLVLLLMAALLQLLLLFADVSSFRLEAT